MKKTWLAAGLGVLLAWGMTMAQAPAGAGAGKGGPPGGGGAKGKGKGGPPAYQPPQGPAPKTAWGTPDFNGVWARPYTPDISRGIGELPYTEWGKKMWDSYKPEDDGDYTGSCLPFGHVRSINSPDPAQFIQTPTHFAFLFEQNTWFKVLPIGPSTANLKKVPSWFGDSKGHWEGETLVIETNNFNGLTRLDTNGHPHSDQMKLTEKMVRTDAGHIDYELTIDDPKAYTKPLVSKRQFTLRTDWEILEYSCEENNKGFIEGRIKMPDFEKLKEAQK